MKKIKGFNFIEFIFYEIRNPTSHITNGESYIHPFSQFFIHPSIHSYIHTSIHTFIHSSQHSFIHPSIQAFIHSFAKVHSFQNTYRAKICAKSWVILSLSISSFLSAWFSDFVNKLGVWDSSKLHYKTKFILNMFSES